MACLLDTGIDTADRQERIRLVHRPDGPTRPDYRAVLRCRFGRQPILSRLEGLLNVHGVTGVAVHDARLVSVMLSHSVSDIFTLNERDFRRYPGIMILTPGNV